MTPYKNLIDAVTNYLLTNNDQTKEKLLVAWLAAKEDREMIDAAIKKIDEEIESGTAITPIIINSIEAGEDFLDDYMHTDLSKIDFIKSKLHGKNYLEKLKKD